MARFLLLVATAAAFSTSEAAICILNGAKGVAGVISVTSVGAKGVVARSKVTCVYDY